jgi:CubicO group peptidase (beta-lactamase class C family)
MIRTAQRTWLGLVPFVVVMASALPLPKAAAALPLGAMQSRVEAGQDLARAGMASAQPEARPSPDSLSAQVDRLFERWHRPDSPGAAVLVMRNGEVVHATGYGMANLEHGVPIRTISVFDIASVSKQFGAFAVALLEADGLLTLDDEVHKYIPELPDFGRTITLRHLVHHTSGLRDWPGTLALAGWDYQDVMSFEQILRMVFHQKDLNFDPGAEYAYSNTGYNLLAETVARVSGISFREFCQTRIFGPLGMTKTHFHDDHTEVVLDRADSYRPAPGSGGAPRLAAVVPSQPAAGVPSQPATGVPSHPAPRSGYRFVNNSLTALASSSLFTTVDDLARWVDNFETAAVGGPELVARMHERGVLNNGDTIPYAWGQSLGRHRGLETWSHTGSWAGYRTALMRFPEQRFAVVILANTTEMNTTQMAHRIAAVYLDEQMLPVEDSRPADSSGGAVAAQERPGSPEARDEPWDPTPGELEEYAGEYSSEELLTSYRLEVQDGVLVARHFRTGDRSLRPQAPDRFQAGGFGEVHFMRDDAGAVTGFTANQARIRGLRFERVGSHTPR